MNAKIPLNKHINLVSIFIFLVLTLANAILLYTGPDFLNHCPDRTGCYAIHCRHIENL